jgi:hypothetical protein
MTPASCVSPFEHWHRHFWNNRGGFSSLPWRDSYRLTARELLLAGRSIQQFQLGEYARGRGLMRRAASQPDLASAPGFMPALELFIAEEQGHSSMLGLFLDRECIPRLSRHWIDGAFRRLRKLAGLDVCMMTLATAEVLAIPFYRALRDATRSPLLRAICARILRDEAAHLNFQALTIGLLRRAAGEKARAAQEFLHSVLFHVTALLLWQQHRAVFRTGGWSFRRFWRDSRHGFARLQTGTRRVASSGH